jgi:predicted AAA+ superfamily ATPase
VYAIFRLAPFGPPKIRAVKKEQKLYFWDWTRPENPAAQMENVVAVHLLRLVHWLEDTQGVDAELRYFRTPMGHEVDFVVLKDQKPWLAVEVKADDRPLDSNLKYLLERVSIPFAFQVAFSGDKDVFLPNVGSHGVRMVPARRFLANLP